MESAADKGRRLGQSVVRARAMEADEQVITAIQAAARRMTATMAAERGQAAAREFAQAFAATAGSAA